MTEEEVLSFFDAHSKYISPTAMEHVKAYLYKGYDMNEMLRCNNTSCEFSEAMSQIDKSFQEIVVPKSFFLFRGVPSPLRYMMENTICDKAYCSTSRSFNIGRHFMTYDDVDEQCCIFHIHFEKGQRINMIPVKYDSNNAIHKGEQEILFPRNTKLVVITYLALLKRIENAMKSYELGEFEYDDRFAQEQSKRPFPFKVFKKWDDKRHNYVYVIPLMVQA